MVPTTSDSRGSTTAGQHGATDGGSMECQVISAGNRWRTWCPNIRCMGCDKVLSNEDADHDEHTEEAQGVKAGFVPLKPVRQKWSDIESPITLTDGGVESV